MNLSATRIQMILKCPHQYYLRYILGIKKPPGIAALVGRSVDKTVDNNLQNVIDNSCLLELERIQDTARDELNTEWEGGVLLSQGEKEIGEKKIKGECVDKSIRLATLHYEKVAPVIKPVRIQREWEVKIDGYPYGLTGRMDIQEIDSIRDTKTGKVKKTGAADKSLQLTIYALAGKVLDKKDYKLFFDYLIDNKEPKQDIQETTRQQKDFELLFRKLEVVAKMLEKGIFPPCNHETSWCCDPRYCGYYGTDCKYT